MYHYGAFAHAVAGQFERKWLQRAESLDPFRYRDGGPS